MNIKDIRQMSREQLVEKLADCHKGFQATRESVWSGKEKNVRLVRVARRECARVATILKEKGDK